MGGELSGALTQLARYKQECMQNFPALYTKSDGGFLCADPRCLLICGCTDQLSEKGMLDSFEHIRRNQRQIEIITFDELFRKVEMLLVLLEGGDDDMAKR